MRWQIGRRSTNVEDRRGMRIPMGGFRIPGCALVVIILISLLTGTNPLALLDIFTQNQPTSQVPTQQQPPPAGAPKDEQSEFASVVLAATEDTWTQIFARSNETYQPPRLVLFSDVVQSACGMNSAAVGPFYCPLDSKVYLDLTFFRELHNRFGAPGDFAQAYVIAHEVGHHVQNLLGISDRVQGAQQSGSRAEANELSVRLELQADCFAGVWGFHARDMLEEGDIEEGLNAAAAIGDDRLQQTSGRAVSPESWTHGSSKMRVEWFRRGFQSGDTNTCNTFEARAL